MLLRSEGLLRSFILRGYGPYALLKNAGKVGWLQEVVLSTLEYPGLSSCHESDLTCSVILTVSLDNYILNITFSMCFYCFCEFCQCTYYEKNPDVLWTRGGLGRQLRTENEWPLPIAWDKYRDGREIRLLDVFNSGLRTEPGFCSVEGVSACTSETTYNQLCCACLYL